MELAETNTEDPNLYADQDGIIIGWGRDENNDIPDDLKEADMDILTREGEK